MMRDSLNRPFYLNLIQIRLPIAGIMSIGHRISGVLMVLATPILIWLLQYSLSGADQFASLIDLFSSWLGKAVIFAILWALIHHLFAGIRYLLLDVEIGVDRPWYRYSAWIVMLAAPLTALIFTILLSWRLC